MLWNPFCHFLRGNFATKGCSGWRQELLVGVTESVLPGLTQLCPLLALLITAFGVGKQRHQQAGFQEVLRRYRRSTVVGVHPVEGRGQLGQGPVNHGPYQPWA